MINQITNNSHPFLYNNTLWAHNGSIDIKNKDIDKYKLNIEINGTTDSEYMHKFFINNLIKKQI